MELFQIHNSSHSFSFSFLDYVWVYLLSANKKLKVSLSMLFLPDQASPFLWASKTFLCKKRSFFLIRSKLFFHVRCDWNFNYTNQKKNKVDDFCPNPIFSRANESISSCRRGVRFLNVSLETVNSVTGDSFLINSNV